jgi:septum formation protein
LASASPRRLELLRKHGIFPVVRPSHSEEVLPEGAEQMSIEEKVVYLAEQKGRAVYEAWKKEREDRAPLILSADTVIYKERIIGKPKDEADAVSILSFLRNTVHFVYSGVSLIDAEDGKATNLCDVTKVYFKNYSDEEILRYIREEAPYDKSGSYAIQSSWSANVAHVEGDIENVMGLPWYRLKPLFQKLEIL